MKTVHGILAGKFINSGFIRCELLHLAVSPGLSVKLFFTDLVCLLQLLFADCNFSNYLLNKPGRRNNFLFVFLSLVSILMGIGNGEGLNEVSVSESVKSPAAFPTDFSDGS